MKHPFLPLLCFVLSLFSAVAQEEKELKPVSLEVDYFYGSILEHNPDIAHLITDHPYGFVLSVNRKTYGFNEWERRHRYPDWGVTFTYQNMVNQYLGENYGLYGHYNFYFFKRHLVIRLAQGIAYASSPYDKETNFINNAYGTKLLSTTFLKANFVKEDLWEGLGVHAGFSIIHYSNANLRAPNNSTNTWAFNAGISYLLDHEKMPDFIVKEDPPSKSHAERWKYNFAFRFGMNESDVIGLGQEPFYVFSGFVDKRINYKSTLVGGVDVFAALFLKELIKYRSIAYPEDGLSGDEDYLRVGLFIGHELRFNKVAFVSHLGYYIYWPYEFENRIYNRLGLKRYFYKDQLYATVTVKAHWAKAEGVEFGVGIRL